MNKKEEMLLALRPIIDGIDLTREFSEEEMFQNKTLRPIIKLQHDVLVRCFTKYLEQHKISLDPASEIQKKSIIGNAYSKNNAFRNYNLGLITGFFTLEELERYHQNSTSLNKRILQIIIQRIGNTVC